MINSITKKSTVNFTVSGKKLKDVPLTLETDKGALHS